MPWGEFFTWVGQTLIIGLVVFIMAAAIMAVIRSEGSDKNDE